MFINIYSLYTPMYISLLMIVAIVGVSAELNERDSDTVPYQHHHSPCMKSLGRLPQTSLSSRKI
jgi:hypothetical protein